MKQITPILWLALAISLITACGGGNTVPDPADLPVASLADSDSNVPTVAPVATVPPPTDTPVPTDTPIPTPPTPTPIPSPTPEPVIIPPDNLLIEYGSADYGNPVLMQRGDELLFELLPAELGMEVFFDYSPTHGLLAFGRTFWQPAGPHSHSVSDLWVYDFKKDELTQWFAGNIGRAAWASDPTQPPTLALAQHNGESFDLIIAQQPNSPISIERSISPHFSWAPSQSRLAFMKDGQLLALNPFTKSLQKTGTAEIDTSVGWIADAPIWSLDSNALLYAGDPFFVAPLSGEASFIPQSGESGPITGSRPTKMLWSAETQHLLVQTEVFASVVVVYSFSPNLHQATEVATIDNARLAFWHDPGRTIVLLDELTGEAQIWSLSELDFVTD